MAEVLGLVSSIIAVIELSAKAVGRCKSLIETAKDAPRDLRAILVEVSSLHSALENLQFLQSVDGDLSDNVSQDESLNTAVHGCQNTLGELVDELDSLTISNHEPTATGKRQRIKTAIKWTWKEDSARKLLADLLQHKATITVCLLSEAVHEIREVKSMVNGIHQKLTDEERRKFCSWMEQTNPTQIHASSRDNYEPGTVEWMFRMPQWSSWIAANSPSRSLWIHGIPGAGKTILASRLYKECQSLCSQKNRLGEECLYYYCSYRNNQDETIPALRWIISQVCRKPVYNIPEEVYHMYQQNTTADLETLIRALAILMAQMKTLYLFIDGVDESRPRTQLLSLLKTIITDARFQNLHLLVTSRDYIEIREVLAPLCSTIPMSNEEVDKDIKLFVTSELDKKFIRWREPHKDEVAEILTNKAQGMFRLAVCHIHVLMKRRNLPDMIKALENLPPSIEECYEMMLLEIDEHDRPLARAVFTFVDAHNKLKDTQILPLHSVISMINKNQDNANPLNRQHDRTDIQEVCGCLITLVNATFGREGSRDEVTYEGVKLAHYSVLEYLYSERIKHSAAAFFAMEENANIHAFLTETLGTTLLANTVTGPPAFWHDYEHFCARVALLAPRRWEFRVVQNHNLWNIMSRIWCKKYGYYWHTSELFDFRLSRPSGCSVRITIARKPYVATLQETKAATMAAFLFDNLRDIPQRFLKENTYDEILGWTVDLQESDDDEFFEYNVNIAVSALCAGISVSSFGEPGKSLDQQRYFGPEEQLIVLVVRHRFCRRCHGEKQEGKCSLRDHPSLANCDLSQHSYSSRFAPLQISTTQRDYDATKFLLERGANPNTLGSPTGWWTVDDVTNRTYFAGESPLWRARNAGGNRVVPDKIVALLLDYGAKYFREESRRRH